jgi:hypothetical protein
MINGLVFERINSSNRSSSLEVNHAWEHAWEQERDKGLEEGLEEDPWRDAPQGSAPQELVVNPFGPGAPPSRLDRVPGLSRFSSNELNPDVKEWVHHDGVLTPTVSNQVCASRTASSGGGAD